MRAPFWIANRRVRIKSRDRKTQRLAMEHLEPRVVLSSSPIISEFVASNQNGLRDGYGRASDWIEVYNPGSTPLNLSGYSLTDRRSQPGQWRFPAMTLQPHEHRIVFASGDNVLDPAGFSHTNFSLRAAGEYLGLFDPAGNVLSEFGPNGTDFPPQTTDQSYGWEYQSVNTSLIGASQPARFQIPTNGSLGNTWTSVSFDASSWQAGITRLGYGTAYVAAVGTQVPSVPLGMYVRVPFQVATPTAFQSLTFHLRYDDGFIAYLNGTPIASSNAPTTATWSSRATRNRVVSAALSEQAFVVPGSLLRSGENVLAVHGLNWDSANFLLAPRLVVTGRVPRLPLTAGFLQSVSPAAPNSQVLPGDVVFSRPSATFDIGFSLSLSPSRPEEVIRYTLNGSVPQANSTLYGGPLVVTNTTQVRARAFRPDGLGGQVVGESYIRVDPTAQSFSSNLPLVVLESFRGGVPNRDFEPVAFSLFAPGAAGRTRLLDAPTVSSRAAFHRRGSSSYGNPKWNLRLELRDQSDNDKDVSLLGLPAESDWVLLAPYDLDRALLRDPFLYAVSNAQGRYAPRTRFVEVFVNTDGGSLHARDYMGVYVLLETIKRDANRVAIAKLTPEITSGPELTGGYIIKIDQKNRPEPTFHTARGTPSRSFNYFFHVEPAEDEINSAQRQYIRSYLDAFETALYGSNFRDPILGYRNFIDIPSFIDHHILRSLGRDANALVVSEYLYKDRGGKLSFGPIWDLNRTLGPDNDPRVASPEGWRSSLSDLLDEDWWDRLFQDPDFRQSWSDRWHELRSTVFTTTHLNGILQSQASQIAEAQVRNFQRWPQVAPNGGPYAAPGRTGWDGEISHIEGWLAARMRWIDAQMSAPTVLSHPGGTLSAPLALTLSRPASAASSARIYYTLDGSDPRAIGGLVSSSAILYSGGTILVDESLTLTTRIHDPVANGFRTWSPPARADFVITSARGGGPSLEPVHENQTPDVPPLRRRLRFFTPVHR